MIFKLAVFAAVVVSSYCDPNFEANAAEGSQPNDFRQNQQLQGGQVAFDPSFSIDQAALQFQNSQRLAGNSFFPSGQQGGQAGAAQQQQQPNQQQWTGDMADLSQVLTQNVVAQQVQQLQQGQPDPLAASPYHTLLKNLAGTAPLYPPGAPGASAPQQDPRFPGQIIAGGGFEGGPEVEKLDPPGPPHPPLNVENANYLTAVASIPQRIGPTGFNIPNLPAAFPHQTFSPNVNYMNRGQQAPPSFNPWPANLQSGPQQQQPQQQQQQQHFVQQQQNFHAQFRPANNAPAQRHPAQFSIPASNLETQPQFPLERSPVAVEVGQNSSTTENKTESEEFLKIYLTQQIQDLKIVSYGQTSCQTCNETDKILRTYKLPVNSFLTDTMVKGNEILQILQKQTGSKEIPYVFICGHYVGGYKKVQDLNKQDELKNLMKRCSD